MTDELLTIRSLDSVKVQNARKAIEDIIIKNFDNVLNKALITERDEDFNEIGKYYSTEILEQVKKFCSDKNRINAKLEEHYDTILNNTKPEQTMDLIHLYSDIDVEIKNLDVETIFSKTFSYIKDPNIQWAISGIAKEMLKGQQLTSDRMQIYGSGQYSKTIKIGEYAFKVGGIRSTPKIKNDERIIQPLFRREIGDNDEKVFIEVQDVVDKDWYKGLTEEQIKEELYKVYFEMRNRGNKWTDVKKENVGRLLKPNTGIYNINGQELKGESGAKGFIEDESQEQVRVLEAGELVVIDTDHSFDSKQEEIKYGTYGFYKEFEERYLKEKEASLANQEKNEPALLTSAVEVSKSVVTHKDIQTVAHFVVSHDRNKDIQYEKTPKER